MIRNKIFRVDCETTIPNTKLILKKGQEIEVVMNVAYMGGFPIQPPFQAKFMEWIHTNPSSLKEIKR